MATNPYTRKMAVAILIAMFGSRCVLAVAAAPAPATIDTPAKSSLSAGDLCRQLDECQKVFDSESRDEPWASRMEEQLRIYLGANAAFPSMRVRCGWTLCRISCDIPGSSLYAWSKAVTGIKNQPWYAHFMGEIGTSTTSWPREGLVEEGPGRWVPRPGFVLSARWFLVRDLTAGKDEGASLPATQPVANPIRLDAAHAALIAQSQTLLGFHHAFESEPRDSGWADAKERDIQDYLQQQVGSGASSAGSPGADRFFAIDHVECRSTHCEIQLTVYERDGPKWSTFEGDLLRQPWASDFPTHVVAVYSVGEQQPLAVIYALTRRQ